MKDQKFLELVNQSQTILIISSRPLDFDCLGSGLVLKKYLESLGKKVTLKFPSKLTAENKEFYGFLPYFDELEDGDTREILKEKNFDLLILVDGTSLGQYYDTSKTNDNPPDLTIYDKRIHVDHHLLGPGIDLGTYAIKDCEASSTMEVILDRILPESFIDSKIATLAYAAIAQDTGNFRWSFTPKTLTLASELLSKGADPLVVVDRLFYVKPKSYLEDLSYILNNMVSVSEAKTVFLLFSYEEIKLKQITESKITELKIIFLEDIALKVPGFDRGIVMVENKPHKVKLSAWGNTLRNKSNLPQLFKNLGAIGGGHFNACGADIEGNFEEVKQKLIELIEKHLQNS